MLHLNKPLNILKFNEKLFEDGLKPTKLIISKHLKVIEDIKSINRISKSKKLLSCMHEFLPLNKRMTFKDKFFFYKKNFQTTKSLRTLHQELISKEKDLKPFWTKSCLDVSTKLWLPTKTASPDLVSNYSNTSVKSTIPNLPFSTTTKINLPQKNLPTTSFPSLPFLPQGTTEPENIRYCRKIRIYPNKIQKDLFQKCFGCSRYIYNKGVEKLKNEWNSLFEKAKKTGCLECQNTLYNKLYCEKHYKKSKPKIDFPLSLSKLRPFLMKSDKELSDQEKWMKDIPYDTRQLVIKSLIGNIKSAISNLKNGHIQRFSMNYKTKRDDKQVFFVNKHAVQHLNIFKRRLKKKSKIRTRRRYKNYHQAKIESDCIILKDTYNWYILIPKKKIHTYKKAPYTCCSLDPGVRCFQTMYSPDGIIGKLGDGLSTEINKINKRIDLLKSIRTKIKKFKTKRNLHFRCFQLRTKIKNILNDFQWKLSNYLVKNFNVIVLPTFETQKMVSRKLLSKKRRLSKKTNRMMINLSHYKFQEKMKYQCKKYKRKLLIVNESYTSKTCTSCGKLKNDLGSAKMYNCNDCGLCLDRDVNGARNIYIKTLCSL